ncbi:MAG: hypothetical protein WC435_00680 [Candidatus Paceibacterota bacterium]
MLIKKAHLNYFSEPVLLKRAGGFGLVVFASFLFGCLPLGGPYSITIGMVVAAAGLSLITC